MEQNNKASAKKYAVFSGHVTSKSDGEIHFISNHDLCRLYHVNPSDCVMVNPSYGVTGYSRVYIASLIPLRPQYDGDYSLPSS